MKYYILYFIFVILLVSCFNQESVQSNNTNTSNNTQDKKLIQKFEDFIERKKQITDSVKLLSNIQADSLYERYKSENLQRILDIMHDIRYIDAFNLYKKDKITVEFILDDSLSYITDYMKKAELEFIPIAGIETIIFEKSTFYENIFKDYVTEDYKEFISIEKYYNHDNQYINDSLTVSIHELGIKIEMWEAFINKYPNSNILHEAENIYYAYQINYLLGYEKSYTFDYANNKLFKNAEIEFNNFSNRNKKSYTTKLINLMKSHLDNQDGLEKLIYEEQHYGNKDVRNI